jgi:hypothetical protein
VLAAKSWGEISQFRAGTPQLKKVALFYMSETSLPSVIYPQLQKISEDGPAIALS